MADNTMFVTIENAELIFRNFEGREGQYNRAGQKEFSVILPPELAEQMLKDGWNVKTLNPREEGEEPTPYITVAVNFDYKPPRVVMITNEGNTKTNLDEGSVAVLDWADIRQVDLIIRSYFWTVGDKTGIKAYLKSLFVTIEEDELERKYGANEPDVR